MRNLFFILICSFSLSAFSQFKSKTNLNAVQSQPIEYSLTNQHKKELKKSPVHDEYVVHKEKLKTYFVNDQIPSDFPKYIETISYEENKKIAMDWALENPSLLKENFRNDLIDLK